MKQRIATAAVLIPLILLIVGSTSPLPISIAAIAMAAIGVYELAGIFNQRRVLPVLTLGSLALPFYSVFVIQGHQMAEFLLISGILFLLGAITLGVAAKHKRSNTSIVDIGGLWVSMPMLSLIALHELHLPAPGMHIRPAWQFASPTLLALVPVWAGDIAAIFVGRAIGRHPLSNISPGKTVEGAIANLVAAILAGWGIVVTINAYSSHLQHIPVYIGIVCGCLAGTLGQAGDLFQSYLKRCAGVKDSGRLLPGHGGLLDRIDSVLFAAVPIAIFVYFGPIWLRRLHVGGSDSSPTKTIHLDDKGARIVGGS